MILAAALIAASIAVATGHPWFAVWFVFIGMFWQPTKV